PAERVAVKDRVARGHVGDRTAGADRLVTPALGHLDVVGQRRAADGAEIEPQGQVPGGPERCGDLLRRLQLAGMALAVVEGEREPLVSFFARYCERRRRVEPAGGADDRAKQDTSASRSPSTDRKSTR